jgi:hypothetical protein
MLEHYTSRRVEPTVLVRLEPLVHLLFELIKFGEGCAPVYLQSKTFELFLGTRSSVGWSCEE